MVIVSTIDKMVCAAIINTAAIVKEELKLVAPFLSINRHRERATKFERVRVQNVREQERKRGCQGQQPCCLVQQCESNESRV
jgi:hypothetical protein